jgi:hypothetical protein
MNQNVAYIIQLVMQIKFPFSASFYEHIRGLSILHDAHVHGPNAQLLNPHHVL